MVTLVIDTNILVFASLSCNDFKPEAVELLWNIHNVCHSIAVDEKCKIVEQEYKKYMRNNQMLITWWTHMRLKGGIKYRSGQGIQIGNLKELDNCFACVAIRTPDRILITDNERDFNGEIKKKLARKGVKILCLHEAHKYICRN